MLGIGLVRNPESRSGVSLNREWGNRSQQPLNMRIRRGYGLEYLQMESSLLYLISYFVKILRVNRTNSPYSEGSSREMETIKHMKLCTTNSSKRTTLEYSKKAAMTRTLAHRNRRKTYLHQRTLSISRCNHRTKSWTITLIHQRSIKSLDIDILEIRMRFQEAPYISRCQFQ